MNDRTATRLIVWILAAAAVVVLVTLVLAPAVHKSDDYNACRDRVVQTGRPDPDCD